MNIEARKPTGSRQRALSALGRVARNGWVSTSAGMLAIKMTNLALGLATVILFARLMGSEDYGLYVLVLTVAQFLSMPLHMGLPTLLVREISIAVRQGNYETVNGIQRFSLALVVGGSVMLVAIAGALYFAATAFGLYRPASGLFPLLLLSAATIPVLAMLHCGAGVLGGFRQIVRSRLPEGVLRPALLLAAGGAALWFLDAGPVGIITIYLCSAIVAVLFSAWLIRRAQPAEVATAPARFETRTWLLSLLPLTGITAVAMVNSYLDIMMLGALRTTPEVAEYRVANQIGMFPLVFQAIGLAMIAPRIAAGNAAGDRAETRRIVTVSARLIFAGALGFVLLFWLFGDPAIRMVFGAEYADVYWIVMVLFVGVLVSTICGPTMTVLNMTHNERSSARVSLFAAVINVVLNGALIPFYGALGAAAATAIATSVLQVFAWSAVIRSTGLRTDIFAPRPARNAAP